MADTLQYRQITGLWTARLPDGSDQDEYPDTVKLSGRVTFHPEYKKPLVFPGEHIVLEPIPARIVDGLLMYEALVDDEIVLQDLYLPVTADERGDQGWSWRMVFDHVTLGQYGEQLDLPDRRFPIEAGDGPLDLSRLAGTWSGGRLITRGPEGPPPTVEWDGAVLVVGGERSPDLTGPAGPDGRDEDGRLHSTPVGLDIFFDDLGDLVVTASDAYLLGQDLVRISGELAGTGVRNITGMVSDATGGQVLISRKGPVVELALVNLLLSGASAWGPLLTLPSGFRPALPAAEAQLIGSASGIVSVRRSDGRIDINRLGSTTRHKLTFTYLTNDPYPTTLPGVPA